MVIITHNRHQLLRQTVEAVTPQTMEKDISDYPETHEMTRAEWVNRCGDYGLTIDGRAAA